MKICMIICMDASNGIGKNNDLPWKIPRDLVYFKKMTLNKTIIMGRKTWESIGSKPLPKRNNLVVGTNYLTLQEALETAEKFGEDIFIIGGGMLYRETMRMVEEIYLTQLDKSFDCDTHFPIEGLINFSCEFIDEYKHGDVMVKNFVYRRKYSSNL